MCLIVAQCFAVKQAANATCQRPQTLSGEWVGAEGCRCHRLDMLHFDLHWLRMAAIAAAWAAADFVHQDSFHVIASLVK